MMQFIIVLLLMGTILVEPPVALGDEVREQRPNLVGVELGGRGLLTMNYERYLSNQYGVGIGGMVFGGAGGVILLYASTVPVGNTHSLYLSGGVGYMWDSYEEAAGPVLSVGYQMQSTGGFFLRLSMNTVGLLPVPGIALGGSF